MEKIPIFQGHMRIEKMDLKVCGRQSVNVNYCYHCYYYFKTVGGGRMFKNLRKSTWLLVHIQKVQNQKATLH